MCAWNVPAYVCICMRVHINRYPLHVRGSGTGGSGNRLPIGAQANVVTLALVNPRAISTAALLNV